MNCARASGHSHFRNPGIQGMSEQQQLLKRQVAAAALEFLRDDMILGVGTGSTVNALIDQLAPWVSRLKGAVSSSDASTTRLRALGVQVMDLNEVDELP